MACGMLASLLLNRMEFGVQPWLGKQLLMLSALDNLAAVHDDNKVRVPQGADPMRNNNGGLAAAFLLNHLQYPGFGHRIDGADAVVQDQERRLLQQPARKARALALASGQRDAPLPELRLETIRKLDDIVINPRLPRRRLDFVLPGIPLRESDIFPDRRTEEEAVLRHVCDLAAQALQCQPSDIRLSDENRPFGRIIRPQQQLDERRFAAAGFADALTPNARFDSEGLLTLPQLHQVAGQRVVIFRGEGGRTLLADTLAARGADVRAVVCYRRVAAGDAAQLKDWLARGTIAALTATSRASLDGLLALAGPAAAQLKTLPLAVLSAALVDYAQHAGFCGPIMSAREASDAGLVTVVRALLGSPTHPR